VFSEDVISTGGATFMINILHGFEPHDIPVDEAPFSHPKARQRSMKALYQDPEA
jgi:hypothetical protein